MVMVMNAIKIFLIGLLSLLFTFAIFPLGVQATYSLVPNGSFETGDLTDWTVKANQFDNSHGSWGVQLNNIVTPNYTLKPADGNFWLYWAYSGTYYGGQFSAGQYATICTSSTALVPNGVYDYNFGAENASPTAGYGGYPFRVYAFFPTSSESALTPYNNPFAFLTETGSPRAEHGLIYYSGTVTNDGNSRYFCLSLYQPNNTSVIKDQYNGFDFVRLQQRPSLINSITTDSLPRAVLQTGYIYVNVTDSLGNTWTGTDASVKVNFNGAGYQSATWDSSLGKYKYLVSGLGTGNYTYDVNTSKNGYTTATTTGNSWTVTANALNLTVNCISNCSPTVSNLGVSFGAINNSNDVIWRVVNNNIFSVTSSYLLSNSSSMQKQYFVYTSTDGSNWVFRTT